MTLATECVEMTAGLTTSYVAVSSIYTLQENVKLQRLDENHLPSTLAAMLRLTESFKGRVLDQRCPSFSIKSLLLTLDIPGICVQQLRRKQASFTTESWCCRLSPQRDAWCCRVIVVFQRAS
jgi:hypothetical protein